MELIDIHTHIAPNIDDGCKNIEESIRMIQKSVNQGCTGIFLTPHSECIDYKGSIFSDLQIVRIKKEVLKRKIPIEIYQGSEIYTQASLMKSILEKLLFDNFFSMNNTRYVLIEFNPYGTEIEEVLYCMKKFLANQWIPILAHAERFCYSFATIDNIREIKKLGCLIQTNYYSLYDEKDNQIKQCARYLLDNQLIDFMGTDCHRLKHRPPKIQNGYNYIIAHCNDNYIDKIIWENAERYLNLYN